MNAERFVPARLCAAIGLLLAPAAAVAQNHASFRVLGFYTAREDTGHIRFVMEANPWFARQARENNFVYDSTRDWSKLNDDTLARVQVVLFLDTRPEKKAERAAFERFIRRGGAWMGFHFAAFALDSSAVPDDWPWYQDQFLGCGAYKSNVWRPVPAQLRVETPSHPAVRGLPIKFRSAANEWYRWEKDLRKNDSIQILLAIDPASFPLGTGPKPWEIWHSGYYPVAWTNRHYRMIYCNMGHDDADWHNPADPRFSSTFASQEQSRFLLQAILWLGRRIN